MLELRVSLQRQYEEICEQKLQGCIKIHDSFVQRLRAIIKAGGGIIEHTEHHHMVA